MIGETLKELRKAKRYTQKEIGEMCGVSDISVYKWETNRAEPNIDTLCKLADIYGVSLDCLLGRVPMDVVVKNEKPPALAEGEERVSVTIPDGLPQPELDARLAEFVRQIVRQELTQRKP